MSELSLEQGTFNSELTRLRQRLEHSPKFHARLLDAVQEAVIATDVTGRVLYWNRFAEALYGWSADEALGRNVSELKTASDSQVEAEQVLKAIREGGTWSGEILLRRKDGTTFPAHVSDAALRDAEGQLIGIVEISYDITPRKTAEQKQILLIRELHHRVKNTLSTVQAIMATTARSTQSVEEFQDAFMGRVAALAKTHMLLTEDQSQSASFLDILRGELEPYDDGTGTRIKLDGPHILLPSAIAVPLGMAIHELATNAAKHGALSDSKGSVTVRWSESKEDQRHLCWDWKEHNGSPLESSSDKGFGTKLLQRLLTTQIGAQVQIDFEPAGVRVFVSVPLPG